jgi:hypothetical protein
VQYTVSAKLIRLIELTLISTGTRININSEYTEEFEVEYDIKQGDTLSANLYSVVVDVILQQLDVRGNISTRLKQCSADADDILITRRTKQSLIDTFQNLKINQYIFDLL